MDAQLSQLFPIALSSTHHAQIREHLHSVRVGVVDSLLSNLDTPATAQRLGPRVGELHAFLSGLLELSAQSPERFGEIFGHWSLGLMLGSLMGPNPRDDFQRDQLLSNICALRLTQALEDKGSQGRFTTTSDFYDLLRDRRVRVQGADPKRVQWELAQGAVTLRAEGAQEPFAKLPLPLATPGLAPHVSLEPLPRSEPWGVPIVDNRRLLSLLGSEQHDPDTGEPTAGWEPLTMKESTTAAHGIIKDLWPEVLDWAGALLTAFVDMNAPPRKSVHRSASYGAGSPIFLTRVDTPFKHAEDVVHELQHQRMFLTLNTSDYGLWHDSRQIFVSPYRSDPRPLQGLHLGIHAFLAVNRFRLRVMERMGFTPERRHHLFNLHRTNLFSFRTMLEHEQLSAHGRAVFVEYARELISQHKLIEAFVTPEMNEAFNRRMGEHTDKVRASGAALVNDSPDYMNWEQTVEKSIRFVKDEGGTL
ncbi:aKG-HExxH-type peptide beta-hydroxylase [Hyalangium rubrum]|uniref:HEXXH motif-containing putative peptide modification protein n=1 Tax=Hyalangium rubrum TaxID=3103134 RepID=A0ABU5H645_9BACT|nr:HEXXH motif-containing putative peptide modification protein [Hyalangium sp. s54d21]MDY7228810.1 HEXXH motif-containing putative peptide modification protein [Hyalangium sp. s54d21]